MNNQLQIRQDNAMGFSPDTARIVQEVQGAIVVAQHCPRNEQKAYTEIINACKRQSLAEQSMYSFPRGGTNVTGPSIRLAEVIARHWGNLQYGIRELSTDDYETKYEAYCWDVQTNTRASRIFTQKHGRWTKKNGFKSVDDPRDVYEVVASSAARRLRACILEIIPGDIVEEAQDQCKKTLTGNSDVPLTDRIRKMVQKFSEMGVTEDMISARLGHKVEVITEIELVNLRNIWKSISDGMSRRDDWFDVKTTPASDLNNRFGEETVEPTQAAQEPQQEVPVAEPPKESKEPEKKAVDPKEKLKSVAKSKSGNKVKNHAPGAENE